MGRQARWNRILSGRAHTEHPRLSLEQRSFPRALERPLANVPAAFWLGAAILVSAALRFLYARTSATPWILPDEYIYADLARNFADSGHFVVNGAPMAAWSYGPLYSVLLAPIWAPQGSAAQAYATTQLVNSILISSTAAPAYLLARRVLDKRSALFLAVLTVLVPSMVYSSKMMTESLAYPAFMLAMLLITRMLERPTNARQLATLLAIGAGALARIEMIALLPAVATAMLLVAGLLDHGQAGEPTFRRRLLRFRLTIVLLVSGAIAFLGVAALNPGFLGGHARSLHSFDLFAAGSTFVWLVLFVVAYSTGPRPAQAAQDRLLFYVVPLELLAFLLWIRVDLPRPRRFALP